MSESSARLSRKIHSAGDLQAVVRTMKALAASSLGQYEHSARALVDYHRTVELGLCVCLRGNREWADLPGAGGTERREGRRISAIVFGSDQGLVGQFNDKVADHAVGALAALSKAPQVWAVGERVEARLVDAGLTVRGCFPVPASVRAITPLVGQILVEHEALNSPEERPAPELHLYHNRTESGSGMVYAPVGRRILPLDADWSNAFAGLRWPTQALPEIVGGAGAGAVTLRALLREFLFVSLFRACAESLASENASRLAAMERADRNIDEMLASMKGQFHQLRQSGIDAELFDVIAGFEALGASRDYR
jgi:F-type H+-transporting ATPase subunit gamma